MSETTLLDPESLDPDALDPDTYHAVVGPALQSAAAIAADRGDPTLAADMSAMLALIELIRRLSDARIEDAQAHADMLQQAPAAACVMVMQEAELDAQAIGQCLAALETAYAQLAEHDVLASAGPLIDQAAAHLRAGRRETALADLRQAVQHVVAAIEAWQDKVH